MELRAVFYPKSLNSQIGTHKKPYSLQYTSNFVNHNAVTQTEYV